MVVFSDLFVVTILKYTVIFVVRDLSVCVCAAEINACTDDLLSFAVCLPNKACYVIKKKPILRVVQVCSLLPVLEDYNKDRLFACLKKKKNSNCLSYWQKPLAARASSMYPRRCRT